MAEVIKQFFKNIVLSYSSMVIGLIVTLLFTPYLISELGKERYGIWAFVFSIVGYMDLADVGMRQSIVRFVSKHLALEDWPGVSRVISSATRIYLVVALVIVAATFIVGYGFLHHFQIDSKTFDITRITLIIIGINSAISFLLIPFSSMGPFHRFDIATYVGIPKLIIQTIGIVALLEAGFGLVAMACWLLVLTLIDKWLMITIRRRLYPNVRISQTLVSNETSKELLRYAFVSFLILAAWIVIYNTDNIVIGLFLSMEAVAIFAIPATMIASLRNAVNAIAIVLVPAISHFDAEQDLAKILRIYAKSTRYLYYLSTYFCVCSVIFGGPFILLWIGESFAESISILIILMIPAAIQFPQFIAHSVLLGISKHRITFYVLSMEAVANIILSIVLVQHLGLIGVALGTAIPQLIIYTLIYPVAFYREMQTDVRHFYLAASKSISYGLIMTLPAAWLLSKFMAPSSWFVLILECAIVTAIMLAGLIRFILEPPDRERAVEWFTPIFRRWKATGRQISG